MKWNESGFRPPLCTYRLNWADTGFEIRALAVWGRARYLSVTEAPHNTNFHTWMGKKHFFFFQTAETGNRTPDSGVKGSGANHYPRAPALLSATKLITRNYSNETLTQYCFNVRPTSATKAQRWTSIGGVQCLRKSCPVNTHYWGSCFAIPAVMKSPS